MILLIRIVWFFMTTLIYHPVITGLNAINAGFLIKSVVILVFYIFVYYVPSNAFIAMWKKRSSKNSEMICRFIWETAVKYADINEIPLNPRTLIYVWTGLYYCILDMLKSLSLDEDIEAHLISITCKYFQISKHNKAMINSLTAYHLAFLNELKEASPHPNTPEDFEFIHFNVAMAICPDYYDDEGFGDFIADPRKNVEFARALSSITQYIADLFNR